MRAIPLVALSILVIHAGSALADDGHRVQARLLASVDAVAPGDSLYLGIQLVMDEGWHTYWRFAGDAGLPTEVAWLLPDGFEADELLWPVPNRFEEPGNLVVYGYADSVLLMSRVRVPENLSVGKDVMVGAEVSWLACRELCIPGDAELYLTLGVGSPSNQVSETTRFARTLKRVPSTLVEDERVNVSSRAEWQGEIVQVDLQAAAEPNHIPAVLLDFFPIGNDSFESISVVPLPGRDAAAGRSPGEPQLRLLVTPFAKEFGSELNGVLVYRLEQDRKPQYATTSVTLVPEAGDRSPGGGLGTERIDLLAMDFRHEVEALPIATYVVFAILGGFILNLMPCVLPVISIKILSIVSQASESRPRIRQLGLSFSAGILATFMALAGVVLALRSGGEQIGWGFQFQYPGFVMAMTAIIFVLALSLFGLFTIRLPGSQGSVGGFASGAGQAGSFANGVLATILATPCTAPFLGTALGFAFAQPLGMVVLIFFCIGVGMALPYVLLALQPGWLRFLPRPGAWMERFKQSMGFLFVATSVWLLWVLGNQLGMEGVVWMLAFLLCLSVSAWIIGQWIDLATSKHRRTAAWIVAGVITAGAYGFFLHPVLAAEEAIASSSRQSYTEATNQRGERLNWQPFSVEMVERLLADGQHVFVDFTAEWCWTCKVNERTVLGDRQVRARFEQLNVHLVKADWTNRNAEITTLLKSFGRSGVPLYVLFPAGRADRPIVFPEIITVGLVLDKLDAAVAAANAAVE